MPRQLTATAFPCLWPRLIGALTPSRRTMKHTSHEDAPTVTFRCEVEAPDLEAFVACLALGTLEAMKSAAWSSDAGTWTLARPVFWRTLESAGLPADLLAVLQSADELAALEALGGHAAMEAELDKMIDAIRGRLRGTSSHMWRAEWHGPETSLSERRDL